MTPRNVVYVGNSQGFENIMHKNVMWATQQVFKTMMPRSAVYVGNSLVFKTI